jgi:SAM-dependent methyltransferase
VPSQHPEDVAAEPLPVPAERRLEAIERAIEELVERDRHLSRLEVDLINDISALRDGLHAVTGQLRARPARDRVDAHLTVDCTGGSALGFRDGTSGDPARAYSDFEAMFRGDRAEIRKRQEFYAGLAANHQPVLDLGCGRGELLELLRQEGIPARGVDLDEGMVAEALEHGLDAARGDLFAELEKTPDGSVGLVFSAQVIEHLPPAQMPRLLAEAHRVLADDGMVVIETVNPHSVQSFRFFWLDITHTIPVYPESMLMLARGAGFGAAVVVFPQGSGDLSTDLAEAGDYAMVAAKDADVLVAAGLLDD